MNPAINTRRNALGTGAAFLLSFLSVLTTLQAQNFEYVYGVNQTQQVLNYADGVYIDGCNGDGVEGYVSVTTTDNRASGYGYDIYAVRTDMNGVKIWEKTYDIADQRRDDHGVAIARVYDATNGWGFVIAGHSYAYANTTNPKYDVCILRIDCDGTPLWDGLYGATARNDEARGMVVTQTAGQGMNAGDYVVAGVSWATAGTDDALLLRISPSGTLLWGNVYRENLTQSRELFNGVTEMTPFVAGEAGDITAVGRCYKNNNNRGYIVRVDGVDGSINAGTLQGAVIVGGTTNRVEFRSVIELQNPNERGPLGYQNAVVVGEITNGSVDMIAVKLSDGYPCAPVTQQSIDEGNGAYNIGYDVYEVPFATNSPDIAQWDLVVVGSSLTSGSLEVTLNNLILPGLQPNWVSKRYGGINRDEGRSIVAFEDLAGNPRLFMTGYSESDLSRTGDWRDLYLLASTIDGVTDCENTYSVVNQSRYDYDCVEPIIDVVDEFATYTPFSKNADWGVDVCPRIPKSAPVTGSAIANAGSVSVGANPVGAGEPISLKWSASSSDVPVSIDAVDALGQVVQRFSGTVGSATTISTDGWTAGVYHLIVRHGESASMLRVVIE